MSYYPGPETTKINNRAAWVREYEFISETLTITREGTARLVSSNGGQCGAWESKSYHTGKRLEPRLLSLAEAAALLEDWGIEDAELARVKALKPYTAAMLQ